MGLPVRISKLKKSRAHKKQNVTVELPQKMYSVILARLYGNMPNETTTAIQPVARREVSQQNSKGARAPIARRNVSQQTGGSDE